MKQLTESQIKTISNTEHIASSNAYVQIPTSEIIRRFTDHGFTLSSVQQANWRKEEKAHKVKHLVRMQVPDYAKVTPVIPEVVIMNSSDSSSSLKLNFGAIRMACLNQLVFGDLLLPEMRIKHTTKLPFEKIDFFVDEIRSNLDKEKQLRQRMENQRLALYDVLRLSEFAIYLREDVPELVVDPLELKTIQRREDTKTDLWTIFNVLQENLIQGNYRKYYDYVDPETDKLSTVIKKTKILTDKNKLIQVNKQLHQKCAELVL